VQRLGGQLRLAQGPSGNAVIGWDMAAAFALASALGLSPLAVAEMLPPIEAVMVQKLNERMEQGL
jgi:hypothetical protein